MFYSEVILSKRGPLGKVWLAAHWERKLSKTQTLQIDISESVDAILGQEIVPMALRLSGQLLLGVCRIYNRKAKYLLDDCGETLLKIRMAFRPGVVDMTEHQLRVPSNAITLSGEGVDIDLLMPDINWDARFVPDVPATAQNIARLEDITLPNAGDFTIGLDDGYNFDFGPLDGISSHDIDETDWPFDPPEDTEANGGASGPETMTPGTVSEEEEVSGNTSDVDSDDSMAPGIVMRPAPPRPSLESLASFLRPHGDDSDLISHREPDIMQPEADITPLADRLLESTLSEPPATPRPGDVLPGITFKTAELISQRAEETERLSGRKKGTSKKLIVDSVAELAEERRGRRNEDLSAIQTEQQFLPYNATVARLLEIRADPIAHFLPTKTTPNGTFFCAAPPGLPPALTEMFMFPTIDLRRARGATPEEETRTPKRPRISEPGEELEVEYPMHPESSMHAPSEHGTPFGPDVTFQASEGFGGLSDHQPFDVGDITPDVNVVYQPSPSKSPAQSMAPDHHVRSHHSTPGPGRAFEDLECPISTFDHHTKGTETWPIENDVAGEGQMEVVSKNTAKALSLLQDQLRLDETEEEKVLSFAQLSAKATRRAASAIFFELLLLSTHNCIKVSQETEFADIEVRAKGRLWEQHVPARL